eukprot:139473_1
MANASIAIQIGKVGEKLSHLETFQGYRRGFQGGAAVIASVMGWSECSSDVEENHTTYLPPRPSLGFKNQNNSSSYNIHGSTETSTDLARRLHEGRAFQNVQMASSSSLPKKQLNTKKGGCERGDGTEKYEPVVTFGMGKNVTTVVG